MDHVCAVCSVPSTLRCTRCKSTWYCGKPHQVQHWGEIHKKQCEDMKTFHEILTSVETNPKLAERVMQNMMAANMDIAIDVEGETPEQRGNRLATQLAVKSFMMMCELISGREEYTTMNADMSVEVVDELLTIVVGTALTTLGFVTELVTVEKDGRHVLALLCAKVLVMCPTANIRDGSWEPPKDEDGETPVDFTMDHYAPCTGLFAEYNTYVGTLMSSEDPNPDNEHLEDIRSRLREEYPVAESLLGAVSSAMESKMFSQDTIKKAFDSVLSDSVSSGAEQDDVSSHK